MTSRLFTGQSIIHVHIVKTAIQKSKSNRFVTCYKVKPYVTILIQLLSQAFYGRSTVFSLTLKLPEVINM